MNWMDIKSFMRAMVQSNVYFGLRTPNQPVRSTEYGVHIVHIKGIELYSESQFRTTIYSVHRRTQHSPIKCAPQKPDVMTVQGCEAQHVVTIQCLGD